MNIADLIVLIILAAVVGLALRSLLKSRKNGTGCSGACASCGHSCSAAGNLEELEALAAKKRARRQRGA